MRGLIFQEQDPPSNTVSPFWLSDYSEFYLDVDYAPHTLVTDIHKMSDWLPHKNVYATPEVSEGTADISCGVP